MKTPGEIKFELDQRLAAFAKGGPIPKITGVHSVVVEDGIVSIGFDVALPGDIGAALFFFNFPLPPCLTTREEACTFARWLMEGDYSGGTLH
jgi:hypothetical protein